MDGGLLSLIDPDTVIRVSSTLDKSVGKKHLVDGDPGTCWTSQQGLPQYIQIAFNSGRVIPKRLILTFQGGFVGTHCAIQVLPGGSSDWQILAHVYPEDVNRRQSFDLTPSEPHLVDDGVTGLKLVFEKSSDFFGRITVYDLKLEGSNTIEKGK
ncbi:hypothetical protein M378DRAFT_1020533 [Amanita muscaria Koide BX008]|uniref:Galactose-binding like protein n=1 Tax=Amanita muscaria (strain Koide BX008) TaxID=946122 RepID=A0A0C2T6P3_AMAMK|nr:hypothetical protein M378DRAFT_1020533 [Amanita muscaria Koide BX008]